MGVDVGVGDCKYGDGGISLLGVGKISYVPVDWPVKTNQILSMYNIFLSMLPILSSDRY